MEVREFVDEFLARFSSGISEQVVLHQRPVRQPTRSAMKNRMIESRRSVSACSTGLSLLILVIHCSPARADFRIADAVANDAALTFGYCAGQEQALSRIAREFPQLAGGVDLAERNFAGRFRPALDGIDSCMTAEAPTEWGEIKRSMFEEIRRTTESQAVNQQMASTFLATVSARANGEIQSPVLETLLMFHPKYRSLPALEFTDGYRHKYICDGSGKAKGVVFSIELPTSWTFREGDRPNIVQKFISANGHGYELAMLLIQSTPMDLQTSMKEELDSDVRAVAMARETLPEGATFGAAGMLTIEGLPGYWCRYSPQAARARNVVHSDTIAYTVFWKHYLIQLQCQVAVSLNGDTLNTSGFDRYEGLFDLIANSLVISGLY